MSFEDEDNYPSLDKLKIKIGDGEDNQDDKETEAAGAREGSAEKKDQPETITPDQAQSRVHAVVVKAADTARRFFDTFKKGAERIGKAKDQMLGAMLAPIKTEDGVAIDTGLSLAAKQAVEGVRDFGRNIQDMNQNAARAFLDSRPLQSVADSFKALVSIPGEVFRRQRAWKEFETAAKEADTFQETSKLVAETVQEINAKFLGRVRAGMEALSAAGDDSRIAMLNRRMEQLRDQQRAVALPVFNDRDQINTAIARNAAEGKNIMTRYLRDNTDEDDFFLEGDLQAWREEKARLQEAHKLVAEELKRVTEPSPELKLYSDAVLAIWRVRIPEIDNQFAHVPRQRMRRKVLPPSDVTSAA